MILAGCAAALLIACRDEERRGLASGDPVAMPRTLRVGYAQEPPYAFAQDSGWVSGLAPELLRAMQPALGVDSLRFVLLEFDRLLGELEAGRVDVIGAGLFITPERAERAAFTSPMAEVRGAVLLRREDPLVQARTASADSASPMPLRAGVLDGAVGVLAGAVEVDIALASGIPSSRLVRYPDVGTAVPALLGGEIQALLLSEPSLRWLEARFPDRLVALVLDTADGWPHGRPAFATRRRDLALAARLDSALAAVCREQICDSLRRQFGFRETP